MARRSTRSPTGHTILAVDDQQDSLVSVRNLLEREGHRILTAESGERAQAELVANCSHEFRTPLNIIAGYAELLLACDFGELPPEAVKPVRSIEEAARSLADLVSDFLRYAKIQAGVESVRQEWVDV